MSVKVIKISKEQCNQELLKDALEEAGQILQKGGLVAFPTETVYGLGANALDKEAAFKIYEAKGRPSDNPLIIHIDTMERLSLIAREIPEKAVMLATKFWPGPLTMIFSKTDAVPEAITGGLDSVAVRIPNHQVALTLIEGGGGYIAAPSANTSGRPSPTKAAHVIEDLSERIDMVVDGGDVAIGLESTIVDFTSDEIAILRPGYITQTMIEEVIGKINIKPEVLVVDTKAPPKAPGMKYTHYAPKAPMFIFRGTKQMVASEIRRRVQADIEQGYLPGIICTDETIKEYPQGVVKSLGGKEDEDSIAKMLYSALRDFDGANVTGIYSEAFDTPRLGMAIMNRLEKAAGHKIIKV